MKNFLITSGIIGVLVTAIFGLYGITTTNKSNRQIAELQLTAAVTTPTVSPENWQPISLDYNKAAEYGISVFVSEWPTFSDHTQISLFPKEGYTDYYYLLLFRTLDSNKNIECGMALVSPINGNVQVRDIDIEHSEIQLLSKGSWGIFGSQGNIHEFENYTEFSLKNNPLCHSVVRYFEADEFVGYLPDEFTAYTPTP